MTLIATATRLKQFGLHVCFREACTRVLRARLIALKALFSQFGAHPVDRAAIDCAIEDFLKEERRRVRLLEALTPTSQPKQNEDERTESVRRLP